MSEDIIATEPWQCGSRDCESPGGWHLADYWAKSDGEFTVDKYSDGDHESIDEADVPDHKSICKSWQEYWEYMLKSGCDPLKQFTSIAPTRTVRKHYTACFHNSILGPVLVKVSRSGKSLDLATLPQEVMDYLDVKRRPRGASRGEDSLIFDGNWDYLTDLPGVTMPNRYSAKVRFPIDTEVPQPKRVIAAETREAARLALRISQEVTR